MRDAEALAAWIGRYKKLRNAGVGNKKAVKLAGKQGGMKEGGVKAKDRGGKDSGEREHRRDERKDPTAVAKELKKKIADDDDPFAEDYYDDPFADDDDDLTPQERRQQEKYEAQVMKGFEDAERGKLYNIFQEMGGLKTRDDLKEEYREIPNTYKRKDGMAGDEMAEYLGMYYPEFGIESERDLIDFFAA